MRRFLAFIGGLLSGGVIGAMVALFFAPDSENTTLQSLRDRYANARQAGQDAAAQKRQELEAQWQEMTGASFPEAPPELPPPPH